MPLHDPKTVRHYNDVGHAHCLTFSCYHGLQLLDNDATRLLFLDHLEVARHKHDVALWAYVLMPNHAHLLIRPRREHYSIADILKSIKQPVGYHGLRMPRASDFPLSKFWQAGPGFDENIVEPRRAVVMTQYIHNNPVRKRLVESVEDWRWSSARFWAGRDDFDLEMDPIE
jgi:putative transposase